MEKRHHQRGDCRLHRAFEALQIAKTMQKWYDDHVVGGFFSRKTGTINSDGRSNPT
jgi:hypothetical protein